MSNDKSDFVPDFVPDFVLVIPPSVCKERTNIPCISKRNPSLTSNVCRCFHNDRIQRQNGVGENGILICGNYHCQKCINNQ